MLQELRRYLFRQACRIDLNDPYARNRSHLFGEHLCSVELTKGEEADGAARLAAGRDGMQRVVNRDGARRIGEVPSTA
jgi:hypothetical protein